MGRGHKGRGVRSGRWVSGRAVRRGEGAKREGGGHLVSAISPKHSSSGTGLIHIFSLLHAAWRLHVAAERFITLQSF